MFYQLKINRVNLATWVLIIILQLCHVNKGAALNLNILNIINILRRIQSNKKITRRIFERFVLSTSDNNSIKTRKNIQYVRLFKNTSSILLFKSESIWNQHEYFPKGIVQINMSRSLEEDCLEKDCLEV